MGDVGRPPERSTGIHIREASPSDIAGLLDAIEIVAAENRWIASEAPIDRERMAAYLRTTIETAGTVVFAALDGERVVGSLGIHRVAFGGVAEFGMSLLPEYRGRGIGGRLMKRAIAYARECGYHKLALYVHPWNEAAVALYRKSGFTEEGYLRGHVRRRNGERWDLVAMGMSLDANQRGDAD